MTETTGILWAFDVGADGPGVPLEPSAAGSRPPTEGFRWIHFDANDPATETWIRDPGNGITPISATALLAKESRPRVAIIEDELLVVLRGVNLNPGSDPEDMVAIRVLIESQRVISVRRRRVLAATDLRTQMAESRPPRSPVAWLAQFIERLLDRMKTPLEELDECFDELELRAMDAPAATLRRELGEARRSAVTLRRYLTPQREAILRLAQDPLLPIPDPERLRLRESADRISRYIEDLEANRERASVTQEELAARLAETMNSTSYRLTLVAAIFLPLGFVTGLLGVNVGGIPLSDNHMGFWVICASLLVVTTGQFLYFRAKKWW